MSTYVPIQAITLSATASSVDFTGIPQTFTDLVIVANARYVSTNTGQGLGIRFNGDTSSNYSFTILEGNGSAASSYRVSNTTSGAMGAVANGSQTSFAVVSTSIQNYTNNNTNKTYIARQSGPSFVQGIVGLWRATPAPITSISIFGSGTAGNIDSGSTFTLYGIGSGSPKAFGGNVVATDGTYWYHAFTSSGRFEPVQSLSADVLIVAGGGGAGFTGLGGPGGAGGILFGTSRSFAATPTTIAVGAGGVGAGNVAGRGSNGGNSFIGAWISNGGGGGGASPSGQQSGLAGGSGGGGCADGNGAGGAATQTSIDGLTGYGNNGGSGAVNQSTFNGASGGGGGAGAAGTNGQAPSNGIGGNGGNGLSTWSSWGAATNTGQNISGTRWFGGGGAGAAGGPGAIAGNAGNGGGGAASANGTSNTGGGAGSGNGNNGGSGIVIVRYLV